MLQDEVGEIHPVTENIPANVCNTITNNITYYINARLPLPPLPGLPAPLLALPPEPPLPLLAALQPLAVPRLDNLTRLLLRPELVRQKRKNIYAVTEKYLMAPPPAPPPG